MPIHAGTITLYHTCKNTHPCEFLPVPTFDFLGVGTALKFQVCITIVLVATGLCNNILKKNLLTLNLIYTQSNIPEEKQTKYGLPDCYNPLFNLHLDLHRSYLIMHTSVLHKYIYTLCRCLQVECFQGLGLLCWHNFD